MTNLSLCVIHRRAEELLPLMLDSIVFDREAEDPAKRLHVDEIVLVHTGQSMDWFEPVREWAEGLGVIDLLRLAEYTCPKEWELDGKGYIGDFSAARNFSFGIASGTWRMFLDADDTFEWRGDPTKNHRLSDWLVDDFQDYPHNKINCISMGYLYNEAVEHDRFLLWKNWGKGHWSWDGPLHELVEVQGMNSGPISLISGHTDNVWIVRHHGDPEASKARNMVMLKRLLDPASILDGGLSGSLRTRLATALASELLANDDREGVSLAEDVIGQDPKSSWALVCSIDLGYFYMHRGMLAEAQDILARMQAHQPTQRGVYIGLGEVLFRQDDFHGAGVYFDQAYFRMPGGFDYRKLPIDEELNGRITAAKTYLKLDNRETAARAVLKAVPENLRELEPNKYDLAVADVEMVLADRKAAGAVLTLVHYLESQDEADRAITVIRECVPKTIEGEKDFKIARRVAEKRWRHIEDPELYDVGYDEATSVDWGPDEGRPYGREILRRVTELAPKTFLDVGANTGWLVTRVAKALPDCQCYGLEISGEKVKMARKRAHMLGVGARCRFFVGSASDPGVWAQCFSEGLPATSIEAASCTEVIEHVDSPEELLDGISEAMKPGGTFFCTTPDVEQYRYLVARARRLDRPISESDGTIMEQMGHVRAYDAHRFIDELDGSFFDVVALDRVDAFQDEETGEASGDGILLLAESKAMPPILSCEEHPRLDIHAHGFVNWGPRCHLEGFAGGSEQAVAHLAPRLAALGWDVHVYSWPLKYEDYYRGVWWHHVESWNPMDSRDALLLWRQSGYLPGAVVGAAGRYPTIYWAHDVAVTKEESHYPLADVVFALSPYHVQQFRELGCNVVELQNGVDLPSLPDVSTPKNPNKVIYGSSADRGLLALLRMWPKVLDAIPEAELHFCYSLDLLKRSDTSEHLYGLARQIEELMAEMPSVINHGGLKHKDFLELAATCGTWAYPCVFPEISCIVAMEMQALGVWPVTTDSSALATTVIGGAKMSMETLITELGVDPEQRFHRQLWHLADNADSPTFRGALIDAMLAPPSGEDRLNLASQARSLYDWDRTARLFDEAIREAISGHSGRGLDKK